MRTQFNQVLLHTLVQSLPTPTYISYFINFKTSTCWNPIITILSTWPNHRSLLQLTASVMHSVPSRLLSSGLDVLLVKGTSQNHLTIIYSVLSNLAFSSTFIALVALAYRKPLWVQALYTFTLREAPLILAMEPVPWTLPRHNVLLLLMLLLLVHLYLSSPPK